MPEYLSPGVYVEEIPSGNKPIAAAGTSTAGMIGMCARGPVNVPTLVTSHGGFTRIFGGLLHPLVFTEGRDALPYAAEGFFVNGGARLFVVRIVGEQAANSFLDLEADAGNSSDRPELAQAAVAGTAPVTSLVLTGADGLAAGARLLVVDGEASEVVTLRSVAAPSQVRLTARLRQPFAVGAVATLQVQSPFAAGALGKDAMADETELVLTASTGLAVGQTLVLGAAGNEELVEIAAITPGADAADPVTIGLARPLTNGHVTGTTLALLGNSATTSALTAASGDAALVLSLPAEGFSPGDVLLLSEGSGADVVREYARIDAVQRQVDLEGQLASSHSSRTQLVPAVPVLRVHARYPGIWGDSLRIRVRKAALVSTKLVAAAAGGDDSVLLASAFGLFAGSVVRLNDRLTREVLSVETSSGHVRFTQTLGEALGADIKVESQEFSLTVERMEAGKAVESETFERLSLAPNHPRYVLRQIGSYDAVTGVGSASGGSNLIRVEDLAASAARGLPLITDAVRSLAGGNDDVASVDAEAYKGADSDDPNQRTGICAMRNEAAVSIVAVPGQTSVEVQQALVVHCEQMRYRFAVLDTPIGANLDQAKAHRQNFDSTRCAIYYPSLERADSFGAPGDRRIISPSGHVMGIYARTDTTRGVHKAPANEVVRGILAFDVKLDKGAQDLLNPINLNCFRDFRSENRGLRVYGARVATSDPEYKYINVRRLLLMIEQSLDIGLQWAVFEPNDRPLWDTVKQSVTGFLTTIWRSGALEGRKAEEAFFVNIGYDITMTQDDIDNGRMIVEIGVAPVKPAEFVIVKISQKTREAES